MTYEEGVALLGLGPGADAKTARKAYLKLIKVHSPERDPEGFMRVRTAYEVVEARLRYTSVPNVVVPAPTPELPAVASLVELADAQPANAFDELQERVWAADDAQEAVELARNAVDRFGTAEAYELLANQLEGAGRDEEIAPLLREARAAGAVDVGLLERIAPAALTDEELHGWSERARGEPTASWTMLVRELLRRGLHAEAARVVSATVAASRNDPIHFPIHPWAATEIALKLVEHAQPAAARELLADLAESPSAGNTPAVRTALVRELVRVAPELPPASARALAAALLNHDPADAELDLAAYARKNAVEARAARKALTVNAPLIAQCYGSALGAPLPWRARIVKAFGSRGDSGDSRGPASWLVYIAIFAAIRLLVSSYCNEPSKSTSRPDNLAPVTQVDRYRALSIICVNLEDQPLCEGVRDLFNAGDCSQRRVAALRIMTEYARMREEGTLRDLQEEALQSIAAYESASCPGLFERSAQ